MSGIDSTLPLVLTHVPVSLETLHAVCKQLLADLPVNNLPDVFKLEASGTFGVKIIPGDLQQASLVMIAGYHFNLPKYLFENHISSESY